MVGVRAVKRSHSPDIGSGEPRHIGKLSLQIHGKPIDDGGTPAFLFLLDGNRAAYVPVELDEVAIDGESGADLCGTDALLEVD